MEAWRASEPLLNEHFPQGQCRDVPGLCKVATLKVVTYRTKIIDRKLLKNKNYILYLYRTDLGNEELEVLNAEVRELEERIIVELRAEEW
ncbi:MAG: hypothetical protein ACE5NG_12390 [bacterium]